MTFTEDDIAPASGTAQPAPPEEAPPPLPKKKSAAEAAQDFRELLAEKVLHAAACRCPLLIRCVSPAPPDPPPLQTSSTGMPSRAVFRPQLRRTNPEVLSSIVYD